MALSQEFRKSDISHDTASCSLKMADFGLLHSSFLCINKNSLQKVWCFYLNCCGPLRLYEIFSMATGVHGRRNGDRVGGSKELRTMQTYESAKSLPIMFFSVQQRS